MSPMVYCPAKEAYAGILRPDKDSSRNGYSGRLSQDSVSMPLSGLSGNVMRSVAVDVETGRLLFRLKTKHLDTTR